MVTKTTINPIIPVLQQYAWGMPNDSHSQVEKLYKKNPNSPPRTYGRDDRFAELWMGCHPNGMATVIEDDGSEVLIDKYTEKHQLGDITYMFKVLSVDKPLSLQLHPSKKVAEELHAKYPSVYKDPNHKPEIAIALSDEFHALAGFRPGSFMRSLLGEFPIIRTVLFGTSEVPTAYNEMMALALKNLVQPTESSSEIQAMIDQMVITIDQTTSSVKDAMILECFGVFKMLVEEYNGDKSVFSAFIMNRYILKKGECIYLDAGLLHAYLKGDCVECMASSDNVIRGGLTPKFIDVPNLLAHTRFEEGGAQMIIPARVSDTVEEYKPPVDDFIVKKLTINADETLSLNATGLGCRGLSMGVIIEGKGTVADASRTLNLQVGTVFSMDPGFNMTLRVDEPMSLWIATQ